MLTKEPLESATIPDRVQQQDSIDRARHLADIAISGTLLAITFPLLIIVALAVKWEGAGPVLESRECIGRRGRRFQMLKFRTTVHDPEHATPAWAQKTTGVGQFLRYTRIDVLPQLINVLRGEMTLIDSFSSPFVD
jgi:lipopolysaccharide/colanic/teichoic acid biosynthesis glycosyltransferase